MQMRRVASSDDCGIEVGVCKREAQRELMRSIPPRNSSSPAFSQLQPFTSFGMMLSGVKYVSCWKLVAPDETDDE